MQFLVHTFNFSTAKAYINMFSKILSAEYAPQKIIVQTVTPNQVTTNLAKDLHDQSRSVPANDFVRYALQAVGSEQQTSAHPKHKFINQVGVALSNLMSDWLFFKIAFAQAKQARAAYDRKVAPLPEKITS